MAFLCNSHHTVMLSGDEPVWVQDYGLHNVSVLAERIECATVNIAAAWVRSLLMSQCACRHHTARCGHVPTAAVQSTCPVRAHQQRDTGLCMCIDPTAAASQQADERLLRQASSDEPARLLQATLGGPDMEQVRVQGAVQMLMDCVADIVEHEGLDVLPAMSQVTASCTGSSARRAVPQRSIRPATPDARL